MDTDHSGQLRDQAGALQLEIPTPLACEKITPSHRGYNDLGGSG